MTNLKRLFFYNVKFRQYRASVFVNGLIYFLGRLPVIGKYVPTTMLYREYGIKKGLTIIQMVFKYLFSFVGESFFFVICYFLANFINQYTLQQVSPFFLWVIFFCMIWTCFSQLFSWFDKEVTFVNSFKISKVAYVQNFYFLKIIFSLIYSIPGLVVFGIIADKIFFYVLFGLSLFLFFSLFWGAVNLRVTILKKMWFIKSIISGLFSLAILGASFFLVKNNLFSLYQTSFENWISCLLCLMLCSIAFYYYQTFSQFEEFTRQIFATSESLNNFGKSRNREQEKYLGEGKKMKLSKTGNEKKLENKNGMSYINALLFSRFKTSLNNQLLFRLALISLVMLCVIIISVKSPIHLMSDELETMLYNLIPSMFFVLYIASFGKKVTQTLFVNCDSAMLAYPFYRESKPIIQGFFYRFFKIFYYNGLIGGTIFIWLIIFNVCNQFILSYFFFSLLLFVMISLTILFSFHDLFIYYILQPFTSDLEVKNPIYKVLNGLFYLLAYASFQLKTGGFIYAVIVSFVSIIYFVIGSYIIVKYAPKTFKLKN